MLVDGATATDLDPSTDARATRYAAKIWDECRLPGTVPKNVAYTARTFRNSKVLCHFETGVEDRFFIVVLDTATGDPEGYLPFDIGGQYRPVTFVDLSTGYEGEATESILADALPRLMEGGTPAAMLTSGEGSYIQTYQEDSNRFLLEYQLVTTAFHYAVPFPLNVEQTLRAFHSSAFGRYEWTHEFAWVIQPLPDPQ